MRKVIIMRGLPGSGKSRHVDEMRIGLDESPYSCRVVSADHYFSIGGQYRFDPKDLGEAHAVCFYRFIAGLTTENDIVIVDNTNTSAWEISPYVLGAQAYSYDYEIVEIACDPEVAAARNIHGVSFDTIAKMAERMKEPLPPFWNRKILSPAVAA